jgi:putative transposase
MPPTHRPYPSDLTGQEWDLLAPLLASPERRGRPPKWPARRIADAVFYLLRSGSCAWRMLPREYPLGKLSSYHFRKWGASTGSVAPSPRAAASSSTLV